jgi:hypothetical protein
MAAPREALCSGGFVTRLAGDATAVQRTAIVKGSDGRAVAVDAQERAFFVGTPGPSFTTTLDAFQPSPGPGGNLGPAVVPLGGTGTPEVEYATYAGAAGPLPGSARIDGDGGVYIGMQFVNDQGHAVFPVVNALFASVPAGGAVMHCVHESRLVLPPRHVRSPRLKTAGCRQDPRPPAA